MAFPRIVSRDEIEELKQEIGNKEEDNLQISIENLNKSINELIQLFKATIIELKSNPQDEVSKKLDMLIARMEESNQLNRQLLELQKEHLPKISKKEVLKQFQKPQTMQPKPQPKMQPQPYQPYQPTYVPKPQLQPPPFQDIDLPPLDEPPKPKKGFFGFGK